MSNQGRIQTKVAPTEMIKIGNSASNIYIHTCQPKDREELEKIIKDRISKEGYECDLNDIDVSLVEDMSWLFKFSDFNVDISKWNTSNVKFMHGMFARAEFNQDISKWNVSSASDMYGMFDLSKFNQDISNWKIRENCNTKHMFDGCSIKEEYKPKSL